MSFWDRFTSEVGRISNQVEDNLPGWMPTWMKHHVSSAVNPLGQLTLGDTGTQYYTQRFQGQSPTGARQSATGDALRSVGLAALAYGGLSGAGALGGGSAAGGAASGAGAGSGAGELGGGALSTDLVAPTSFGAAAPSVGGTGTAAFQSAMPSVGGSGFLGAGGSFVPGASSAIGPSSGGFDWGNFLHNYGSRVQQSGLTGRGAGNTAGGAPGAGDAGTGTSQTVADALRQSVIDAMTQQAVTNQGITFPQPRYG